MQQDDINAIVGFGSSVAIIGFTGYLMNTCLKAICSGSSRETSGLHFSLEQAKPAVTVYCPICGKLVEIPDYGNSVSRSDALKRHIEREHGNAKFQAQVFIEGRGMSIPLEYRGIIGFLRDPLPAYGLLTMLPAVDIEVGEKKIDAVLKQLKAGVEDIQNSEHFRKFLTTMAKFHDYSIGNQILIMLQKPEATHVAGFNTWRDLGRQVRKGEKGIAILAPVMPPKARSLCAGCGAEAPKSARYCPQCGREIESGDTGEAESPKYFRVVYVFDLSQTEGEPLPEFAVPVLTGEASEDLFHQLLTLMKNNNIAVSFETRAYLDSAVKGQYGPEGIWIRPEESRAQQLKTLLHEIAHHYSEGVFRIPRQDAETIAESAAFVVGAHFGFDTGVRSFPYVALWAKDKKVLEANLGAIRKVSAKIIESLESLKKVAIVS
ncbi:MAG: ArdC-like ssDNA-binding domain-containing protein [Dehalococcoidales bacterium]|nr:ArdC-like ssDNA-binding domain-containing protein [Dehalococcoidales bacterium]